MKRWIIVLLTIQLAVVPWTAQAQSLSGEVKMAGSSTVYPIATALAEEFSKKHPNVRVPVSSTGSGGGFANFFCVGKTDLNNASRPIKDSELEQCSDNGVRPVEFQVATDALTVVVNNNNDWARCMTVEELRQIWKPNGARKWSDVNPAWPDREIEPYGAASTSGTFDYLTEVIVGEEDAHRQDYQGTEHDNTIVQAVSGSRYAIGYFGFAYYDQNKDRVRAVAVDDGNGCVKPSLKTAQKGKYTPLARPLFTYASRSSLRENEAVRAYTKFLIEKSATDLVAQVGYVPVTRDIMRKNLGKLTEAIE